MPGQQDQQPPHRHDAFLSYSRKDEAFASALEHALERYTPPKGLAAPHRHLEIFRDKQDFTGSEYHESLEKHLSDSAKLIVICSPNAFHSIYVNDEIRRFARMKSPQDVIPVLVSGIPNNEARTHDDQQQAFPPALCEVMEMPLAADFRGFRAGRRINERAFESAWYTTLANLYGVSRAEIEQRDRKRRARTRRIAATAAALILTVLTVAGLAAWRSRQQAAERTRDANQLRYVGNIKLAQQAYDANDMAGMSAVLKSAYVSETADTQDPRGFEWFYLWGLSQGGTATVSEHKDAVAAVAFSPDGKMFASGGADHTIVLWSADHREIGKLTAGDVLSLAFSPHGTTLASAEREGPLRLWNVASRTMAEQITELGTPEMVTFSSDGKTLAAVGHEDGAQKIVKIWDVAARQVSRTLHGDTTASASNLFVALSPDGSTVAFSSGFGVKLARLPSGQPSDELWSQDGYVSAIAFSPDGATLAAATEMGTVLFIDTQHRRIVNSVRAHEDYIATLAYSPDGRTLATASADHTVKLWDVTSRTTENTLKGHGDFVTAIAFSPDGRTLVSGSRDRTVRRWTLSAAPEFEDLTSLDFQMNAVAAAPGGNRFALATASSVVLWDADARRKLGTLEYPAGVNDVAISSDAHSIAIGGDDGSVELWDAESHRRTRLFTHAKPVTAVAFSTNGTRVASASDDQTIRLWDLGAQREAAAPFKGHTAAVTGVAFSPDDRMLASVGNDGTVRLWDAASGRQIATAVAIADTRRPAGDSDNEPLLRHVVFSHDGRLLAAAAADGRIRVWSVSPALTAIATLEGHTAAVNDVAFSPDGRTIVSGSDDRTVKLWDTSLFRELITFAERKGRADVPHVLAGSENQVRAVAFSGTGEILVSGLVDGTVRFRRASLPRVERPRPSLTGPRR